MLVYLAVDRLRYVVHPEGANVSAILAAGFTLYSLLIGSILASLPRAGVVPYALMLIALAPHFLGVDHQLRHADAMRFDRYYRWLLAVALLIGWLVGLYSELPKAASMAITGFVSGAMLVNAIIEELPREGRSAAGLAPFVAGVALFTVLAVLARTLPRV
jgi:hypothetical protein